MGKSIRMYFYEVYDPIGIEKEGRGVGVGMLKVGCLHISSSCQSYSSYPRFSAIRLWLLRFFLVRWLVVGVLEGWEDDGFLLCVLLRDPVRC